MSIRTPFHPMGGQKTGPKEVEINITARTVDFNVYNQLVAMGVDVTKALEVVINVAAGVVVGASSTAVYAFQTGALRAGSKVTLNVGSGAYITGAGGAGGAGGYASAGATTVAGSAGANGGIAMFLQLPISINNLGTIQSGGAGGKGGNGTSAYINYVTYWGRGGTGGQGAGYVSAGTLTAGSAGTAGSGRDFWDSDTGANRGGSGTAGATGGAPGSNNSIVRNGNLVTWINQGTVKGTIA